MTSLNVQPSRLVADLSVTPPVPNASADAPTSTAVTLATPPPTALDPIRSWATKASRSVLPGVAGSSWLLTLGLGFTQGVSPIMLAAVAAAGVSSAWVAHRALTQVEPSVGHVAPADARTHLNYATDPNLDHKVRVTQAMSYVNAVTMLSGADAMTLFDMLPRGTDWGRQKKWFRPTDLKYHAILSRIGLTSWKVSGWTPLDIEIVIVGLSKLGPVTASERAIIGRHARDIVSSFHGRYDKKEEYRSELVAAVNELLRRAPEAEAIRTDAEASA